MEYKINNIKCTFTGSNKLRQCSTASLVSVCDILVKSSITRHSTRFNSLGIHNLFANSNKFRHLSAEI